MPKLTPWYHRHTDTETRTDTQFTAEEVEEEPCHQEVEAASYQLAVEEASFQQEQVVVQDDHLLLDEQEGLELDDLPEDEVQGDHQVQAEEACCQLAEEQDDLEQEAWHHLEVQEASCQQVVEVVWSESVEEALTDHQEVEEGLLLPEVVLQQEHALEQEQAQVHPYQNLKYQSWACH